MIPDFVADVGNTRIKVAACCDDAERITDTLVMPPDPHSWVGLGERSGRPASWVVASVNPAVSDRLVDFLRARGDQARLLSWVDLPVKVNVAEPSRVGIDRLLNAVAALPRLGKGQPAIIVDAGSAVTVDYIGPDHAFWGGAILPGLRLMAKALHGHTALLPMVEVDQPETLGRSTTQAIRAGVYNAVQGGIRALVERYIAESDGKPARVYFTGGDSEILFPHREIQVRAEHWPEMTLHGILVAARGLQ